MPLESFEVLNHEMVKMAKCDKVPEIMIIAGPNGVGKSTLLETIKKNVPASREGNVKTKASTSLRSLYVSPHRMSISFELPRLLPYLATKKFRETLNSETALALPGNLGGIPNYLLQGGNRARDTPDFTPSDVKRRLADVNVEFNQLLRTVYDRMGGEVPKNSLPSDVYLPFREFVEKFLHLKFETVLLEGDYYKVYFTNKQGVKVEYNKLSSGEKDGLAIVFSFIEKQIENNLARVRGEALPNEDLIMLIDGPEQHLHPTLQIRLMRYLREQVEEGKKKGEQIQFILVTHSPTIVNDAKPEELFILLFPGQVPDGNQLVKVTGESEKFRIIREVLGDVSLLATGRPILLVEGNTDADILRIWDPTLERDFMIMPVYGKERVKAVGILKRLIQELQTRGFIIRALLDRDYQTEGNTDYIHTWSVPCIENLLLSDAELIFEASKTLVGPESLEKRGIRSKEDMDSLIKEVTSSSNIKEKEIEKRLNEKLYLKYRIMLPLDGLQEKVATFIQERLPDLKNEVEAVEEEVDSATHDPQRARAKLNGKLLMGSVSSRLNLDKDNLSRAIADKMRELQRIPTEASDLFTSLRNSLNLH